MLKNFISFLKFTHRLIDMVRILNNLRNFNDKKNP